MKSTVKTTAALAALVVSMGLGHAALADDGKNVQKGTLKCDVEGGVGMILGSDKDLTCVFTKKDGTVEDYKGRDLTIGIDIGVTKESHITWAVFAPSGDDKEGALAGKYDGVTAEVTVAGGVGANVLVGVGNSITLQPISVQTQEGLNVAGGIGSIKLEYVAK